MASARGGGRRPSAGAAPGRSSAVGGASSLWRAAAEPSRHDPLLLDTHVWFWTLTGMADQMAPEAVGLIEAAAADGRLYVSDISYWELSVKAAKGKLALAIDPSLWLAQAARAPGIRELPLAREALIQSTLLSGALHGDPADRILIAQAQFGVMSLLTCDRVIVEYAAGQPGIPVCDGRR